MNFAETLDHMREGLEDRGQLLDVVRGRTIWLLPRKHRRWIEGRLARLTKLQAAEMQARKVQRTPKDLALPHLHADVEHIVLRTFRTASSRLVSPEEDPGPWDELFAECPKLKRKHKRGTLQLRLRAEVVAVEAGLHIADAEETIRTPLNRAGLIILANTPPAIVSPDTRRRPRRDKIPLEPDWQKGSVAYFDEDRWQRAKGKSRPRKRVAKAKRPQKTTLARRELKPEASARFADAVLTAAQRTPHKFGPDKAFIAGVLDQLVTDLGPSAPGDFVWASRKILPELNRLDLVSLGRADLVGVMDPDMVARSEVRYLNATFHFVNLRP